MCTLDFIYLFSFLFVCGLHCSMNFWFNAFIRRDFWLNEGFTVFLERKILGRLYGEDFQQFDSLLGLSHWKEDVERFGVDHQFTALQPEFRLLFFSKKKSSILYSFVMFMCCDFFLRLLLKSDWQLFFHRNMNTCSSLMEYSLHCTDPDDAFSSVPYERGFNFLYFLEQLVGGPTFFEPFLTHYFSKVNLGGYGCRPRRIIR